MRSDLELWLDFAKALLWPGVTLIGILTFKQQLTRLLERLARLRFGDNEFEFQQPSSEAMESPEELKKELEVMGPGGFFTRAGLANLCESAGLLGPGERVTGELLLFSTNRQHTWLVATDSRLCCILDDQQTRESGRMIQWVQRKERATPIKAKAYKPTAGLVQIGARRDWLYSTALFADPADLEQQIAELIGQPA